MQGNENRSAENLQREGMVRIAPLASIPTLLQELGCDPDPVFQQVELSRELWNHPETEISFISASRLLEASAVATGCDHFGVLLGERVEPSSLGVAGLMLRCAPDPGVAIKMLRDNLNLHDSGGLVTFETVNEMARFGYLVIQPGTSAIDQIYDLSIAVACKIMRGLCGDHWSPAKVLLSRKRPRDIRPHTDYFHAPVEFGAAANAIEFPVSWLNYPNPGADPHLFKYLSERAGELQARHRTSLLSNLQRIMLNAIFHQRCSVEYVAGMLGMHQRTLNRKLGEFSTSFRQELEKQRFELARQMLANSHITMNEIASVLGYSDQAAFSRAFRRWSGHSPSAWRSAVQKKSHE
jgi:AraC-like DNA-binding protein